MTGLPSSKSSATNVNSNPQSVFLLGPSILTVAQSQTVRLSAIHHVHTAKARAMRKRSGTTTRLQSKKAGAVRSPSTSGESLPKPDNSPQLPRRTHNPEDKESKLVLSKSLLHPKVAILRWYLKERYYKPMLTARKHTVASSLR
mmetsp:Transcript_2171/g.8521  ORF Transcript_2171/g.8521 Transcript_2171/m.8521 type:complete len:144 (+) Transcript_2171:1269-1700(+)